MTNKDDTQQTETDFIPIPPDFPVNWEKPDDKYLFWQPEFYFPTPVKPLDVYLAKMIFRGLDKAFKAYYFPAETDTRYINTCVYYSFDYDPEETDAKIRRSMEKLNPAMAEMAELWRGEWLPEIRTHLAYWDACDLSALSAQALSEHLDETDRRASRCWDIHFLLYLPMVMAPNPFEEMHHDLFRDEEASDPYELLSGFRSINIESSRALWDLSRRALASTEVRKVLADNDVADVVGILDGSAEGQSFLVEVRSYLQEYGKRGEHLTLALPAWIENPALVIRNLQDYVTQPDGYLDAELEKTKTRGERGLAEIRDRLRDYPKQVAEQFESLLKLAKEAFVLREEHGHWIDFQVTYYMRRVVLEAGRRLTAAGTVDSRDDVFYLTFDELREAVGILPETADYSQRMNERRSIEKRFAEYKPPMMLGAMPSGAFPDDPLSTALFKIEGSELPVPEVSDGLGGHPASSGTVRGTAKVVRSLSEAGKLEPGDIMVAEATGPTWTPFFVTIAGLVTDTGGVLSHSAIVAREYGIPCVVGTGTATSDIRDGQRIEIDGNKGIVRILE